MLVFPQLTSGAYVQHPYQLNHHQRVIAVTTPSGKTYKALDNYEKRRRWHIPLQRLSDEERNALQALFVQTQGSWKLFTFLDPFDNLLHHSQDFTANTWEKDVGLVVSKGTPDPFGGLEGCLASNPTAVPRYIRQTALSPAWFRYTVSIWAQSLEGVSPAKMILESQDANAHRAIATQGYWTRTALPVQLATNDDALSFVIEVPPLSTIALFGAQMEALPNVSAYRSTTTSNGIYNRCRFQEDHLEWLSRGVNNHSTTLTIMAI